MFHLLSASNLVFEEGGARRQMGTLWARPAGDRIKRRRTMGSKESDFRLKLCGHAFKVGALSLCRVLA